MRPHLPGALALAALSPLTFLAGLEPARPEGETQTAPAPGVLAGAALVASAVSPTLPPGEHDVMESAFCARCHPDAYAEHEQSTHGRAFTDEEVRLATARFAHQDCIICHTPRPIFETGVGQNPKRRYYDLEEGNSCMTCHSGRTTTTRLRGWRAVQDAFHPDVARSRPAPRATATTARRTSGRRARPARPPARTCIDCHMKEIERPIAVGGPVRTTPPTSSRLAQRRPGESRLRLRGEARRQRRPRHDP
jgi:hypothetical protein